MGVDDQQHRLNSLQQQQQNCGALCTASDIMGAMFHPTRPTDKPICAHFLLMPSLAHC